MKKHFAIFGLERINSLDESTKKSGQPYIIRKYPKYFETEEKAGEELASIMRGESPFHSYSFNNYIILPLITSAANEIKFKSNNEKQETM